MPAKPIVKNDLNNQKANQRQMASDFFIISFIGSLHGLSFFRQVDEQSDGTFHARRYLSKK